MKTRKLYVFFLALLTMLLMTVSVSAATVKLNKKKITVPVATKYTLKVTGTKAKVKWISSNKKVATVSSKGVVKGIKKGNCKITATVGKKKYTCSVKVVQQTLKLNASSKTIGKGSTFTLKATIKNAKSKKVVWKSSDKEIATVSAKGVVKGIKSGNATITATLKENKKVSKKFKVIVKTYVTQIVPSSSWKNGTYFINNPMFILYERAEASQPTANISYSVLPPDADNTTVTLASSNTKVAAIGTGKERIPTYPGGPEVVPGPGTVYPAGKGTAVITAAAADGGGAAYSWKVNVIDMKEYIKTVTVTKDNFLQLFGWTSTPSVVTHTSTNTWGETSTRTSNEFYLTNKQYADQWLCLGPIMRLSEEFAVELGITYQYRDPEGHMMIATKTTIWTGGPLMSFQIKNDNETGQSITDIDITEIEVLRVKEGSSVQYLSNMAFRSTSGVKTDVDGRTYVEKTCINGNVYRDYKDHAVVILKSWFSAVPYIFVAG